MNKLHKFTDVHGKNVPLIDDNVMDIIYKNKEVFDSMIDYERDYLIDYFGYKTLERAYLLKINNVVIERPQTRVVKGVDWNS